ncbi:MAG: hypothetical protein Q7T76_15035 [Ferruginibacter sp.]|nr:hypothetical protein [Ferruginibacter sp.]
MNSSKAKIFLAGHRCLVESAGVQVFNSLALNTANCATCPAGTLTMLNEIFLDAGKSITMLPGQEGLVVLVAMNGEIGYAENMEDLATLVSGKTTYFLKQKGSTACIQNMSEKSTARFFQLVLKSGGGSESQQNQQSTCFLQEDADILFPLISGEGENNHRGLNLFAGRFRGRQEVTHRLQQVDSAAFVFVLIGAFEVENRLVEANDGLLIWNSGAIEMEALSNDASILIIEQPAPQLQERKVLENLPAAC